MSFDKTEFKIILGGIGAILLVAVIGINLEPQPSPEPQLQKAANPVPQHESALRRISVGMIQEDLLRAGYDVEVKFIQEDDSKILITGKQVNRSFAHWLMAEPTFRRVLRKGQIQSSNVYGFPNLAGICGRVRIVNPQ